MELFIGEIIKIARRKGMEFFSFLMDVLIKENYDKMILKDMEHVFDLMEEFMKENERKNY